jgi:hypothetical protein
MKKALNLLKKLLIGLGYLSSIMTLIDFILNYRLRKEALLSIIQNLDLINIGHILQIIGLVIVISGFLVYIFIRIFNKYEPTKDLADIIAPLLLSKDILGDPEGRFNKKLRIFKFIRAGVIVLIIGFVMLIITQLYT